MHWKHWHPPQGTLTASPDLAPSTGPWVQDFQRTLKVIWKCRLCSYIFNKNSFQTHSKNHVSFSYSSHLSCNLPLFFFPCSNGSSLLFSFDYCELVLKSEKAMAPHSSTLAWRIPGMGEPSGLRSVGSCDWSYLAAAAVLQYQCS